MLISGKVEHPDPSTLLGSDLNKFGVRLDRFRLEAYGPDLWLLELDQGWGLGRRPVEGRGGSAFGESQCTCALTLAESCLVRESERVSERARER